MSCTTATAICTSCKIELPEADLYARQCYACREREWQAGAARRLREAQDKERDAECRKKVARAAQRVWK